MIQTEFLALNGASTKPAGTRAADAEGAASFLSVLTQEGGRCGTAPAETAEDAAAPDPEAVEAATNDDEVEIDLDVNAAPSPDAGDDLLTAHDDRVAAAIAAADPQATVEPEPCQGQVVSAWSDQPGAGGVLPSGGVAVEPAAIPGDTAPRAGDASPMQSSSASPARGATAAPQLTIAPGQPAAAAMPPAGAQAKADLFMLDNDPAKLRATASLRGDAAAPGLPMAASEHPVPFALISGEGLRSDRDLPARRAAFPAELTGEFAARVTATNGASPSAAQPIPGAPDPALTGMPLAQSPAWAETAEGAARPASGDEAAFAPATTSSQTARAHPVFFAAAEPQRVTQQVAEAVRRSTDGAIELALSPKELGTVRMSIQTTETGTAIVLSAERDETMQLLRRHAGMLHDAFRDLGLGTLDLSFGGRDGKAAQPDPRASGAAGFGLSEPADAPQQPTTPRMVSGGLDLRM